MPGPFYQERRLSPRLPERHEAFVQAGTSLLDAQLGEDNSDFPLKLFGRTRDISATGLSFILPLFPIDEQFCAEEDGVLKVLLYLPNGPVNMQITPVRCIPLDKNHPEKGYFIGARIREMEDDERMRFTHYLKLLQG
jgi:hypothetical protein